MFVDNLIPKWSSANSLSASLRVQKILYLLSPTCVCPNFAGMVQELEHYKGNVTPVEISDGRPRNLIALALETSRSLSFDSKLPLLSGRIKAQNRKQYRPRLMSDDLAEVEKLSDIEMLFQNPQRGSRSNPRNSFSSRKASEESKRSLQYRSLAEGSVKLAMSCWSAGRQNIPKIRIHIDNPDDSAPCVMRSNSLNCLELETLSDDSKMRALSDELLPIPSSTTTNGISYSSAEFDELRASIYSIHGSAKSGSLSTMSLVVLQNFDPTKKEHMIGRRCRSLSDIKRNNTDVETKQTDVRGQSDCNINKFDTNLMTDLFETANILGLALERHLKQQASAQTL
ncbi:unnamed protein product [Hymenolepis diminuta]|uniref:Uncharacterized protein n=1 Tax=Hymenolepis diminuta TaxID=6216 RepID=A0A564Z5D6_HYMDI|nr:unnamed protein product [Hymenolepis diminuta]